MPSLVTLKATGLQIQPNQMDLPPGSLTVASNVVIDRDNVVEKRRGFKLYGNSFGSSTDTVKQLMEYRDRLIRHYNTILQYDNGAGVFTNFPGTFLEPQTGVRIKSIASNNNFYFTSSNGIQKISAANSNLNNATLSNAGGIKAIDMSSSLAYTYRLSTGFLPANSTVAYRAVWGIKDANNNLILGTPSPRSEIYSPLSPLMDQDMMRLLNALDNAALVPGGQTLTDTDYASTLGVSGSTDAVDLRTNLISLCSKLDTDLYPALPSLVTKTTSLPNISTATYTALGTFITFTFASVHNLNVNDNITISGITPGGYNGTYSVQTVPSTTTITVTQATNPGSYSPGGTAIKNNNVIVYDAGPPSILNLSFISAPSIIVGDNIKISGVAPDSFNGNYVVSAINGNIVSVISNTNPGTYVSGGTISKINFQAITQPPTLNSPETAQDLSNVQAYMSAIITKLQISPTSDISTSNLNTYILPLDVTTSSNVNITVDIPQDVINAGVNEYFLQLYRSDTSTATGVTVLSSLVPDDEMKLVYEAFPTQAELTAQSMSFQDITPDTFAGAYLYTNESTGEGILQANETPPFALDIARFKNVAFYANTKRKQIKLLSLLGVSSMIGELPGITPKITITNGTATSTYSFILGVNQVTNITTIADVSDSLNGTYFDINSAENLTNYRFYFKTTGGIDTPPSVLSGQTLVQIIILTGSNANIVAQKVQDALNNYNLDFMVSNGTLPTIIVSNTNPGYTSNPSAGTSGFTISVATSGQGQSSLTSPKQVLLSNSNSPATAVDETARSLVNIINRDSTSPVYAYYVSTAGGVPGQFELEARNLNSDTVYVMSNNSITGGSFNPDISPDLTITGISSSNPCVITTPVAHNLVNGATIVISSSTSPIVIDGKYAITVVDSTHFSIPVDTSTMLSGSYSAVYSTTGNVENSDNETKINRVYYSKLQQPEAVPLTNYFDVGDSDKQILRIFPLRDSLFVFKEEGLYRISGENAPFSLSLFDSSCKLIAQDSIGVVANLIFAWTKKGIETISESGASLVSRPIDTNILKLASNNYPGFKAATFGVGYESDKSYLIWTILNTTDTIAQICYRYSTVTGSWTTYNKTNTCGIVKLLEDKLFLGAGDINYCEQERKAFNRTDYADRELDFNIDLNNYIGNQLRFSSVAGMAVGDVVEQTQTLTPYTYNMLLKKLDIDPGSGFQQFYTTFMSVAGDDMRTKLDQLTSKLDSLSLGFADYTVRNAQFSGSIGVQTIGGSVTHITSPGHNLLTGRYINISGNTSTPSIDGDWEVTIIDANTFSINTVVNTSSTSGTWITLNENFQDIKGCYNNTMTHLNADTVIAFSNYIQINSDNAIEAIITNINTITKVITLNLTLDFVIGPIVVYKAFDSIAQYAPATMGDALGIKHLREATILFDNKAFTQATLSFSTDLLPAFNPVVFQGDGNGIYGNNTFGNGFFGGASNGAPFRTYVPRNNQRCRTLNVKFDHSIARENVIVYGITITGEVGLSTRAYRG